MIKKGDKTYYQVTLGDVKREYPAGTSFKDIISDIFPNPEDDILLVRINGKLGELSKKLTFDCEVKPVTAVAVAGHQTYERSAVLMLLKAFYDELGKKVKRVDVAFSTGNGIYILPAGDFSLDEGLIKKILKRMEDMRDKAIPIKKKSLDIDDAIELFHKHRMYDKEKLFKYRRVSRVNVYSLGSFVDYFYGYMVHDTSYIKLFDIKLYKDGIVLMIPNMKNIHKVPDFVPTNMVFEKRWEGKVLEKKLGLLDVGSLDDKIAAGYTKEMILASEALMEKNIGDIAQEIAGRPKTRVVMIAGPSSSGKTTFSNRLSVQLLANGLIPHPIEVDNYFIPREQAPRNPDGSYNFECLEALDVELFNKHLTMLLNGERVEIPKYNFKTGLREYRGDFLKIGKCDILVVEGIHCLNDKLSYQLPRENKYKIYISAITSLNIDEHNRVSTTDVRFLRRMIRDSRTRGTVAAKTIEMWPSVRRGEVSNIFPFQDTADVVFNSSLIYELAVLKQYAEPLLFGIAKDSDEYMEAKRLLKFLDYFIAIPTENIPNNSILREFIGGSCFNV